MQASTFLALFVSQIAPQLPLLGVFVVGIIIAIIRFRLHQNVSLLAIIGLSVLLIWHVLSSVVYSLVPTLAIENGWAASQMGVLYSAVGLFGALISTAAWICLLVALFGWRKHSTNL